MSYEHRLVEAANGREFYDKIGRDADAEIAALRAELERKDAALKAAESLAHWSNELIMHLEREFGPQPRFSSGHIGKICAAVREFRAALQPKEPPCQKA